VSVLGWRHPGHHGAAAARSPDGAEAARLGLTLVAASLCIFLIQLDFFALNLALPRMASDLDTSTADLQWAISGYMLALAAFLIPGGRFGDIFGRRRMLIVGIAIFGLCSLGAGIAPSAGVVIVFRVLQGIGAGVLFPLSVAVITDAFPPERTMRAIGNAYGLGALAMALGPLFGGGLTELISWRVVLLVNVPVTAAAIAVVLIGVRESRDTTVPRAIDLPGLVAVVLGITAITLAVDRADAWQAAATLGLAALGLLALVAFVLRERVAHWPIVSLDLFGIPPYVIVTLMAAVANVAFVVATFATTIYLQQVKGYTPLEAGVIFIVASAGCGVGGPLSGHLGERFDIPRTIATATLIGSIGLLIVSLGGDLGPYLLGLALFGTGYGVGWSMASVGTQTVVPPERAGQASGVTLAIVIGTAGIAVAAAAVLIEGGGDLGASIEALLRWVAIGSAVLAGALVLAAWRLVPRPVAPATR
jgi:EmrB/QacA subfamily drug resistance transporter